MNGTAAGPPRGLVCTAAHRNEVVALSCQGRGEDTAARVELIRRDAAGGHVQTLPIGRLYVWTRAGRVSFARADGGDEVDLTLLDPRESAHRTVGDRWPPTEHRSKILSLLAGAIRDIGLALTLPASMARMVRTSGRRHSRVDSLVAWCEREIPDIDVLYHAQHGAEHAAAGQLPASTRKGLIGAPGWEDEKPRS